MLRDVNDSREQARLLAEFLKPLHAVTRCRTNPQRKRTGLLVNLIPFNEGGGGPGGGGRGAREEAEDGPWAFKRPPRWPRMPPRWHKRPPRWPKMAQEASKMPQDASKRPQEASQRRFQWILGRKMMPTWHQNRTKHRPHCSFGSKQKKPTKR